MPTPSPESYNYVAIYGAVVSTAVAAWNAAVWWYNERVKLKVSIDTGATLSPPTIPNSRHLDTPRHSPTVPTYSVIEVVNSGRRRTTLGISPVVFTSYKSKLQRFRWRNRRWLRFRVDTVKPRIVIGEMYWKSEGKTSSVLDPGGLLQAVVLETPQVKELAAKGGLLYCEITDPLNENRPASCPVTFSQGSQKVIDELGLHSVSLTPP